MPTKELPCARERNSTRRDQLLVAAAKLFAESGFHGATIEEIGGAAGISGPGVYKHFASKDAVLAEMLVGISHYLLDNGRRVVAEADSHADAIEQLVAFQTTFAFSSPDLIRVHDRELANLSRNESQKVRRLQRAYVELWVEVMMEMQPRLSLDSARTKAHAAFGLLNSTPHSALTRSAELVSPILRRMALTALNA